MSLPFDQQLYAIAKEQAGYFTAKQAVDAGYVSKNHAYHLKQGHWIRESRGIYRLAQFPSSSEDEFILWSLWSRNRNEKPTGIYSHETALNIYEVGEANPNKLHMTVPLKFQKKGDTPAILFLHKAELGEEDIQRRGGYAVTTPLRTILDLVAESNSIELVDQAIKEFRRRGLLTEKDMLRLVEKQPSLARNLLAPSRAQANS